MNKKVFSYLSFGTISLFPLMARATVVCDKIEAFKNTIWQIGGILVIVGWVIAGILYLTSIGSQEKMGTAKKAMTAAIFGTVLIVLASISYEIIAGLLGESALEFGCGS